MTVGEFQKKWGPQWAELIESEMFADAMTTATVDGKVLSIDTLSDVDILQHGSVILARQQGWTKLTKLLHTIHSKPDLEFKPLREDYPDRTEEAKQLREDQEHERSHTATNSGSQRRQSEPRNPKASRRRRANDS